MMVRAAMVAVLLLAAAGDAQASCGIPGTGTVVREVEVVDRDTGRVVHRGEIDLAPTLRRIEAGERSPVGRDDGTAFCARGLDRRSFDDPVYAEYVVLPTFLRGRSPGAQRVIVGTASGRVFYTCDHYKTFVPIEPRVSLPAAKRTEVEAQARQSCRR
jgi:guanyl-specific ribonuclease Sa